MVLYLGKGESNLCTRFYGMWNVLTFCQLDSLSKVDSNCMFYYATTQK